MVSSSEMLSDTLANQNGLRAISGSTMYGDDGAVAHTGKHSSAIELHNAYIAAGTLATAILIVAVVVSTGGGDVSHGLGGKGGDLVLLRCFLHGSPSFAFLFCYARFPAHEKTLASGHIPSIAFLPFSFPDAKVRWVTGNLLLIGTRTANMSGHRCSLVIGAIDC